MRVVDTNLLVRLLVRDDPAQVLLAEAFVAGGAWVSHLVLAETVWVLDAVHERTQAQVAAAIELLLNHEHFAVQDSEVVAQALAQFRTRPAIGFSDCMVLEIARKAGHLPLGTFDRALAKLDGAESVVAR
jgi:predicted nucleic-acid-binding protein